MSNDLILQFLDGSLSTEEEGELLHLLSVSPEKRETLRSYLNQRDFFARDKNAISVPYAAEQKLWARIGPLMPIVEAPTAATVETSGGVQAASFLSRIATPAAAAVAAACLIFGVGIGYVVGNLNSTHKTVTQWYERTPSAASSDHTAGSTSHTRIVTANTATNTDLARVSELAILNMYAAENSRITLGTKEGMKDFSARFNEYLSRANSSPANASSENSDLADIPDAAMRSVTSAGYIANAKRPIHYQPDDDGAPQKSIFERFELSFLESFGHEFPNSAVSQVSLPFITNSAFSVFFQVFPNSNALWVGLSGGAANFSRKEITTAQGNPGDPFEQQLVAVPVHTQTNWAGGFLQYRIPLFAQTDITMTGGLGNSGAGRVAMAELGLHYDVTHDAGFSLGLRAVELSYNLSQQMQQTMQSVRGSLVIPNGVANYGPSYNVELNTGLFFHF